MRRPRIPPIIPDIVQTALSACDGVVFDQCSVCPLCGGKLSGYDMKKKLFAVLADEGRERPVTVVVKRFFCRSCLTVWPADDPFYPDTRVGSPVVDLCITLAATMPFTRAARYLSHMGVFVDRGSIRNYARREFPAIPCADMFGIRLPVSIISLSELALRTGEGGRIKGAEALAACGFPSAHRAPLQAALPRKERNERDEEEGNKERQTEHPEEQREEQ